MQHGEHRPRGLFGLRKSRLGRGAPRFGRELLVCRPKQRSRAEAEHQDRDRQQDRRKQESEAGEHRGAKISPRRIAAKALSLEGTR
jgi:hypothetical protein